MRCPKCGSDVSQVVVDEIKARAVRAASARFGRLGIRKVKAIMATAREGLEGRSERAKARTRKLQSEARVAWWANKKSGKA